MRSHGYPIVLLGLIVSILALAPILVAAGEAKPESGPTAENAMAAEWALARAFRPKQSPDPELATLGGGFSSNTAHVNGTTLHFVRGGMGPAVFLLRGFPEDW